VGGTGVFSVVAVAGTAVLARVGSVVGASVGLTWAIAVGGIAVAVTIIGVGVGSGTRLLMSAGTMLRIATTSVKKPPIIAAKTCGFLIIESDLGGSCSVIYAIV
jgi:hypothetical protein